MLYRIALRLALCLIIFVSIEAETSSQNASQAKFDDKFDAKQHTNWGSYYDPQNVFCGKYDCYQILGFEYEEFGTIRPTTKQITKRYRTLSRVWHPDKNKDNKEAKDRFVVRRSLYTHYR